MSLLVISEHTEETLSLKEWEEKLLVVRDGRRPRARLCLSGMFWAWVPRAGAANVGPRNLLPSFIWWCD